MMMTKPCRNFSTLVIRVVEKAQTILPSDIVRMWSHSRSLGSTTFGSRRSLTECTPSGRHSTGPVYWLCSGRDPTNYNSLFHWVARAHKQPGVLHVVEGSRVLVYAA